LKTGEVTCEGEVIKNPAHKVTADSIVKLEGRRLELRGFRYIMLNKPQDTLCSTVGDVYPSALELLDVEKPDLLRIAGRLDADTTGLVLITDDGQWSHRITSPGKKCGKRYRVQLAEELDESAIQSCSEGIQLQGEKKRTLPAELEFVTPSEVLLTLHEGKYHQVKRMFAALGNRVTALHREQIGKIELDEMLEPGQWRFLSAEEISSV
jgi:16S rRNA pseudouridine516 synthase